MRCYKDIIMELLIGDTPKQKHDNLVKINKILSEIAYPRRGTNEETKDIQDFANQIIQHKLIGNE